MYLQGSSQFQGHASLLPPPGITQGIWVLASAQSSSAGKCPLGPCAAIQVCHGGALCAEPAETQLPRAQHIPVLPPFPAPPGWELAPGSHCCPGPPRCPARAAASFPGPPKGDVSVRKSSLPSPELSQVTGQVKTHLGLRKHPGCLCRERGSCSFLHGQGSAG